jgi:chromosome segregation ATPase
VEQLLLTNLEEVKAESTQAKTQYENSIEDLSRECSSLKAHLQARTEDLHEQTATAEELRSDLIRIEGQMDEERQQGGTTIDKLETEVKNLKEILEEKSESAAQEKRELQVANTELKELLSQSKAECKNLQSDLAAREEQHSAAEHRAESVSNEVRRLQEKLERSLAEQAVQDEELASQTDSFQTERGRLAQGLEVSNANLQKQVCYN